MAEVENAKYYIKQGFILAKSYLINEYPIDLKALVGKFPASVVSDYFTGTKDAKLPTPIMEGIKKYYKGKNFTASDLTSDEVMEAYLERVGILNLVTKQHEQSFKEYGVQILSHAALEANIYPSELHSIVKDIKNTELISWTSAMKDKRSIYCRNTENPFEEMEALSQLFEELYKNSVKSIADEMTQVDIEEELEDFFEDAPRDTVYSKFLINLVTVCTYLARIAGFTYSDRLETEADGNYFYCTSQNGLKDVRVCVGKYHELLSVLDMDRQYGDLGIKELWQEVLVK